MRCDAMRALSTSTMLSGPLTCDVHVARAVVGPATHIAFAFSQHALVTPTTCGCDPFPTIGPAAHGASSPVAPAALACGVVGDVVVVWWVGCVQRGARRMEAWSGVE